jgi:intracellular multiplication protein IcmL
VSTQVTASPAPVPPSKAAKPKAKPAAKGSLLQRLFRTEPGIDIVTDPKAALEQHRRLLRRIKRQGIAIALLGVFLVVAVPFLQPVSYYHALYPDGHNRLMSSLTIPNMTDRAILSWSATAITEVMTMGFGDYETRIGSQKWRFTPDGWDSFVKAFNKGDIGKTFKQSQLVLTTVPSNTPVIIWKGQNEKKIYSWKVQMPVIMTYATNNNVSRRSKAIITLTIVRVSTNDNPLGIGIQQWTVGE